MYAPQGYFTENSLRSFPFREDLPLQATDGFRLPDNLFVDAQLVILHPLGRKLTVSNLTRVYIEAEDLQQYHMTICLYQGNDVLLSTKKMVIDTGVARYDLWTEETEDFKIQLVFGSYLELVDLTESTAVFSHDFPTYPEIPAVELDASTCILPMASVTSVTFQNTDGEELSVAGLYLEGDIPELRGGSNVVLELANGGLDLSVISGRGTGLHNPCEELIGVLKTINGVGPNASGDFAIYGDDCIKISNLETGLKLNQVCKPKCTAAEVQAFAYYLNRVRDGILQQVDFSNLTRGKLLDQMELYRQHLETIQAKPGPLIEVQHVKSTSVTRVYESFAAGIYNPDKVSGEDHTMLFNLTVTPEPGSTFTYLAGSSTIKQDGHVINLPSLGFTGQRVLCRGSLEYDAILYSENLSVRNKPVEFLLQETGAAHPGSAYMMVVMAPNSVYFTTKYSKAWHGTQYLYQVKLDLFDPNITTGSYTRATTIQVSLPAGLTFTSAPAILEANSVKTEVPALTSTLLKLVNTPINYTQKSTLSFLVQGGAGTFSVPIQMNTLSPVAGFSRNTTFA